MMRYQRLSPECLPQANGRKSTTLKTTCKETNSNHHHQHHANGRIPTFPTYESKVPLRVRSASNPSTSNSPDGYHLHHFPSYPTSTPEPSNTSKHKTHEFNVATAVVVAAAAPTIGVESTLPQWGQNKRSRASGHRKHHPQHHPAKIQRRSLGGSDKQSTAAMPPPCAPAGSSAHTRGSNPRACTVVTRDFAGVLPNRNVEERSTGVSRPEKRSCSTAEKVHKAPPASHGHHPSSQMESLNHSSTPSSEKEATAAGSGSTTAPAEKVNLDLFEWPRIYLSLSRKEKEDDFLAMKGTKLPQRPKKRAKNIDKTLQYCFPGMWLSDLTRGRYEVREKKCVKKKRRGLKAMESMDSDSD